MEAGKGADSGDGAPLVTPSTNAKAWRERLDRNQARDREGRAWYGNEGGPQSALGNASCPRNPLSTCRESGGRLCEVPVGDGGGERENPCGPPPYSMRSTSRSKQALWSAGSSNCAIGRNARSLIAGCRTVSGMDRMCCRISGARRSVAMT